MNDKGQTSTITSSSRRPNSEVQRREQKINNDLSKYRMPRANRCIANAFRVDMMSRVKKRTNTEICLELCIIVIYHLGICGLWCLLFGEFKRGSSTQLDIRNDFGLGMTFAVPSDKLVRTSIDRCASN